MSDYLITQPPTGCTPLFEGTVQPAQDGIYLRRYAHGYLYCLWDGVWHCGEFSAQAAADQPAELVAHNQTLPWCGLAEPPAGGYGEPA